METFELPESLKAHQRIYIVDYKPNPIAVKLGYCCSVCDGMKIPALFGEKVCVCERKPEEQGWMENRMLLALEAHAKISYDSAFICKSCHKLNDIWGAGNGITVVCHYCTHEQEYESQTKG